MPPFSIPRARPPAANDAPAGPAPAFILRCPRWLTADGLGLGEQGLLILQSDPLLPYFQAAPPVPNFGHTPDGGGHGGSEPVSEWEIIDGRLVLVRLQARRCLAHAARRGCLRGLSPCRWTETSLDTWFPEAPRPVPADWFSGPLSLRLPSEHDPAGTPFLTIDFVDGRVTAVHGDVDDLVAQQRRAIEKLKAAVHALQHPGAEPEPAAAPPSRFDPEVNTEPLTRPKAGYQGMGYLGADIWASPEEDRDGSGRRPRASWTTAAKLVSVFLLGAWWAWLIMNHTRNW